MSKERPILFNSEMVRAILDGRKTQTRRVIKPQPKYREYLSQDALYKKCFGYIGVKSSKIFECCPYGVVGDRLWVRENIRTLVWQHRLKYAYGEFMIEYLADKKIIKCPVELGDWWGQNWRKRSSSTIPNIHMKKEFARIWLEITDIRVERVQEIDWEAAVAEGIKDPFRASVRVSKTHERSPIVQFQTLWDSINAKRGYTWESNPWVWVVEFRKVENERS